MIPVLLTCRAMYVVRSVYFSQDAKLNLLISYTDVIFFVYSLEFCIPNESVTFFSQAIAAKHLEKIHRIRIVWPPTSCWTCNVNNVILLINRTKSLVEVRVVVDGVDRYKEAIKMAMGPLERVTRAKIVFLKEDVGA